MLRDVVSEALAHPWRTLAELAALLLLVAWGLALTVMAWAVMA